MIMSRTPIISAPHLAEDVPGLPGRKGGSAGSLDHGRREKRKLVVFKSDSHLSQDTNRRLPRERNAPQRRHVEAPSTEVQPKLVITTDSGIGAEFEVGDVIVSPIVRFDSRKWLEPAAPFHDAIYKSPYQLNAKYFAKAQELFQANSGQLPQDNSRPPRSSRAQGTARPS